MKVLEKYAGKVWNLAVKKRDDGSKHLALQIHGVIDDPEDAEDAARVDSAAISAKLSEHADAKTIGVSVNSLGGDAFGGVALYNALEAHAADVTTHVVGLAASAASIVAMAGKTVMCPGAMMMIHPPASAVTGSAGKLRDAAKFLDKVQDAIGSVYVAKTKSTGKPKTLDEISKLVDATTWMTAEEAVAEGFADELGDPPDEEEGTEDEAAGQEAGGSGTEPAPDGPPEMVGSLFVMRGVAFPSSRLSPRVLAMATAAPVVEAPAAVEAPALALVPPIVPLAITRAELAARCPVVLDEVLAEGRAAGVAAERARLKAIDELGVRGAGEEALALAAKYGDTPTDSLALAVAIVKARHGAGAALLAARRVESQPAAQVGAGSPPQDSGADQEKRAVNAITAGINARRGGTKK